MRITIFSEKFTNLHWRLAQTHNILQGRFDRLFKIYRGFSKKQWRLPLFWFKFSFENKKSRLIYEIIEKLLVRLHFRLSIFSSFRRGSAAQFHINLYFLIFPYFEQSLFSKKLKFSKSISAKYKFFIKNMEKQENLIKPLSIHWFYGKSFKPSVA